jgi:hypothetical protein
VQEVFMKAAKLEQARPAPRREAEVLAWTDLTKEQRQVALGVQDIVRNLAESELWHPGEQLEKEEGFLDQLLPRIDAARELNVTLIDGGRGSGKTTVLRTLLDAWTRHLRTGKSPLGGGDAPRPEDGVVPLKIIDLHPLPDSTHLLLHLASRLGAVVQAMARKEAGGLGYTTSEPAWAPQHSRRPGGSVLHDWLGFHNAAAMGWEGNLDKREGHLAPSEYAQELDLAEISLLGVVEHWRRFCDSFIHELGGHIHVPHFRPERTVIVIPVDDADMNPRRSVELLQIVRILYHPRILFLLTGDSELFLANLREHFHGSLWRPQQGVRPWQMDHPFGDQGLLSVNLADEYYNRVIPEQRRVRIEALALADRLRIVEHELRQVAVPKLLHGPEFQADGGLYTLFASYGPFREALPERMRALLALRAHLSSGARDPVAVAHRLWTAAVQATSSDGLQSMLPMIRREGDHWRFESSALKVRPTVRLLAERFLMTDDRRRFQVLLGRPEQWQVERVTLGAESAPLPAPVTAAWLLCTELAEIAEAPTSPFSGWEPGICRVRWTLPAAREAAFEWPLPDWQAVIDFERTAGAWARICEKLKSEVLRTQEDLDHLALRFLHLVLGAARGAGDLDKVGKLPEIDQVAEGLWKLAGSSAHESGVPRQRVRAGAHWAGARAMLLAAPESGLSARCANQLLEAWRNRIPGEQWDGWCAAASMERRRRAEIACGAGRAEQVLEELDRQFASYEWGWMVEGREADVATILDSIRMLHPEGSSARTPDSLGGYLRLPLREKALRTVSAPLAQSVATAVPKGPRAVVETLWRGAIATEPSRRQLSAEPAAEQFSEGNLVRLVSSEYEGLANPDIHREIRTTMGLLVSVEVGRQIAVLRIDDIAPVWAADRQVFSPSPPTLEILHRVAWDVGADQHDLDEVALPQVRNRWWPGLCSQLPLITEPFPWPVPLWPALFDWEVLASAWNDLLLGWYGGTSSDLRINQQRTDELARSFLTVTLAIALKRSAGEAALTLTSGKEGSWKPLLDLVTRTFERTDLNGRRWRAVQAWCADLLLLAAPESGLSCDAARQILAANEKMRVPLQRIKDRRLDRAEWSARSGESPPAESDLGNMLLERIDRLHADHPWTQEIGR